MFIFNVQCQFNSSQWMTSMANVSTVNCQTFVPSTWHVQEAIQQAVDAEANDGDDESDSNSSSSSDTDSSSTSSFGALAHRDCVPNMFLLPPHRTNQTCDMWVKCDCGRWFWFGNNLMKCSHSQPCSCWYLLHTQYIDFHCQFMFELQLTVFIFVSYTAAIYCGLCCVVHLTYTQHKL